MSGDRTGAKWTPEEVAALIEYIRADTHRAEIARQLGRSQGALCSVANRLIPLACRPPGGGQPWGLLRQELLASPSAGERDWWALYKAAPRENRPRAQRPRPKPPPPPPLDRELIDSEPPALLDSDVVELGPLVAYAVGELTDERLRFVMFCLLGLAHGSTTLQSIGDQLGVSRERVRQLEAQALTLIGGRWRHTVLGAAINQFADTDDSLAERLIDAVDGEFRCQPVWLVKALCQMAGYSVERAANIGELASQHLIRRRERRREQFRQEARAERLQGKADAIVDRWMRDAVWPASDTPCTLNSPCERRRMPTGGSRRPRIEDRSFYSDKLGRAVYFESRIEEAVLTIVERSTRAVAYQEQPCEIPYLGADGRRTYFPDLLLTLDDGRSLLIEIKPLWQMALTDSRIKYFAGQRFAAEQGVGWVSVTHKGQTYRDLQQRPIDERVHRTLTRALATAPISWSILQRLRRDVHIASLDVAAYAVQENVALSMVPYRLGGA
ncbi:MAG: TnsA endonuclease N-terminal domain-containing protein [Proteobacteria bacterium]|nr:TnsA endonuclease N-terminal domain-containing protein [Actinomycetes bacterium]MCH9712770.1 TnsA endonuclease N-terminal domain-containing protein [Pseudomonadota bacterium]MCH9733592.1 TnsA endonuclease N-terminal domain-containing protein [Actinomycetes bacterium]